MMKKKIVVLASGWSVDYVLSVLEGMKEVASKNNVDLFVFTAYKFTESTGEANITGFSIFDLIDYKDYDGAVIMPNLFNDEYLISREHKRIRESGIPAVSIAQPLDNLHFLCSDNHGVFKELVLHLINEHNARKLAFIGGPEGNDGADSNFEAYKEALTESGIPVNSEDLYLNGDWSYEFGYLQAQKIFADKDKIPDAVVCVNDWAAMAAINVASQYGFKVPEDVKIVGFDDVDYSRRVIPSITSINLASKDLGREAVRILLQDKHDTMFHTVQAKIDFGQSCGCVKELSTEQLAHSHSFIKLLDREQRFSSQLRHLEDTFIKDESVESLSDNLQVYFEKRHVFEGKNFAILLNQSVLESLREKNATINTKETTDYDENLTVMVNIQNGRAVPARETVKSKDLYPENMKTDKPATYLFLPLFSQGYIHGYYVSKDSFVLLENKSAYNWTRNFGAIIEKYRQTSIYREMSLKYEALSTMDALSGLLNRAGLEKYGKTLFENNLKQGKTSQIMFVDINNMKVINDKYGHLQGDLVVKTVGNTIKACIPKDFIAVRYGGDEFVVIGTCDDNADNSNHGEKISEELSAFEKKTALPYHLTVSVGIKLFTPDYSGGFIQAIEAADMVMYENKVRYHKSIK